jgi:hypothetical protein
VLLVVRSPQLRSLRQLVKEWCLKQEQQQQQQQQEKQQTQQQQAQLLLPWQELTKAYAAALVALQSGASSSSSSSLHDSLSQLLQEGLQQLSAEQGSLLTCRQDSSLESAWQNTHTFSSTSNSSSSSKRYLVAANFHNSAAVLPNFLLQVLRLALKLPRQHLAVSVYESGSSDTSRCGGKGGGTAAAPELWVEAHSGGVPRQHLAASVETGCACPAVVMVCALQYLNRRAATLHEPQPLHRPIFCRPL